LSRLLELAAGAGGVSLGRLDDARRRENPAAQDRNDQLEHA
jgi:hypothetical protein